MAKLCYKSVGIFLKSYIHIKHSDNRIRNYYNNGRYFHLIMFREILFYTRFHKPNTDTYCWNDYNYYKTLRFSLNSKNCKN